MPVTSPKAGKTEATHNTGYSVLLHHYVPSCVGTSKPTSVSGPLSKGVAVHARLRIRHNQINLIMTYDPSKQSYAMPTSTLTTERQAARMESNSPKKRTSAVCRSNTVVSASSTKRKKSSLTFRKGGAVAAASTAPSTSVDPRRHQKQHYVVELKGVSPLAAQMPLSTELRAHLRLNLIDGEAVTYSSHTSLRPTGLQLRSSGATTTTAPTSNFYFPPSRSSPLMPQRLRQDGASAATAPTYGQYLSAEEPFRAHVNLLPASRSKGGLQSRQRSTSLGESDLATVHESRLPSKLSCKSKSPLLTPQREFAPGEQMAMSSNDNHNLYTPSPPQMPPKQTEKQETITDYAELLLVAFFGVVTSAGVPNISFTTDPSGEVMVEKKAKRMSSRPWHKSLFKWFVPSKSGDARTRRSMSAISSISGIVSSSSASPQVSPAQKNASSGLPVKSTKERKASPHTTANRKASSPVSAAAAHLDPQKVLELPFILNSYSTFHLRFVCEEDMHSFLSYYVELQTRVKEETERKNMRVSSPLWYPHVREPAAELNPLGEQVDDSGGWDSNEENEDGHGFESSNTTSTVSHYDYPRNEDAVNPNHNAELSGGSPNSNRSADTRRHKGADATATKVKPPMMFFRSRGWEEYLRYNLDPRFGIPYAPFPLYLWRSFLPLAKLVLYTCDRGFLIVERVPPETSQSDEESSASNTASLSDPERAVEMGKQRLNALVNRLLTPILTAQYPLPLASRLNRHGVEEAPSVVPVLSGDDRADNQPDSMNSFGDVSWDGVKLILPSTEEAAGPHNDDHFTTVKDVFLCLSESHLLFMNSFGHLRFQCSLDEIAMITYSAATAAFPTYPFFRFRLKSSDYSGAPIFVLTFTLLPEVPHDIRAARWASEQATHHAEQCTHARTPSVPSSASSTSSSTASGISHSSRESIGMLGNEEKERLLVRHNDFMRVFSIVCPRPLEFCTFAELLASGMSRSNPFCIARFTSAAQRKVSGSPITLAGPDSAVRRETSWMSQNFNNNPILCVKVEAGDVELYGVETAGEGKSRARRTHSARTQSTEASSGLRDAVVRRRSKTGALPERRPKNPSRAVTPRWGYEDPGIVLQDAGRDMDFSLEVATRAMPLLVRKREVHASYGSSTPSTRRSLRPGEEEEDANDRVMDSNGGEEFFVPMAPKKKPSVILHRSPIDDM